MYQLVNVITDPASPISVCGLFMDVSETLHIDSLRDSQDVSSKFKQAYYALDGALVLLGIPKSTLNVTVLDCCHKMIRNAAQLVLAALFEAP